VLWQALSTFSLAQMSGFSFPPLKPSEIRSTLAELDIVVSDDDLKKPAPFRVKQIYEQLVQLILGLRREDMAQPVFSGIEELDHPELHEESIPMITFLKACNKLLVTAGVPDFTITDITKPEDGKKFRRNLSAIINFAKFREDRQESYVEFTQETDALVQHKARLEDENERLTTGVMEANRKNALEQAETERLLGENTHHETQVRDLFNQQTVLHTECQDLKLRLNTVQDGIRSVSMEVLDAETERDQLKEPIVPDPRKLKSELAALRDAEANERQTIRSLELKIAQHAKQREALERIDREMDEVLSQQAEVEAEQGKLKDVQQQLKENTERASKDESEGADQAHQVRSLSQRNQMAREKNERMLEQHGAKLSVAEQAHADTRRAWTALEAERSHHCRQLEDNDSIVRELRDKLLRGKMEHEAEVASVQQQQQQLAAQVRAYHQDLRTAMKAVSTSNAVLVA
jgi:kinetochore protein Nuf2